MASLFIKVIIPFLLIGAGVWAFVKGNLTKTNHRGDVENISIRAWGAIPFVLGLIVFFISSFSVVSGGQLAVRVAPGNNVSTFTGVGYVPPFTKVVKFDRRGTVDSNLCLNGDSVEETCADAIIVNGRDGGKLYVDMELVYALDTACPTAQNPKKGCVDEAARQNAVGNYLSFKSNEGLKRQIRNTSKDALGEVAAAYTAVDVLTESRAEVQEKAQKMITERLAEKLGVRVVTINFTQIRSTKATEAAVDEKQKAVQQVGIAKLDQEKAAIAKQTELNNAEADAKIKMVNAEAEKAANLERTKGLTPEVLQDNYFKAITGAGTIVTNGETPVIVGK
jgi:regulator of protease activity HflC (stomatin/prohibitin superfamily)